MPFGSLPIVALSKILRKKGFGSIHSVSLRTTEVPYVSILNPNDINIIVEDIKWREAVALEGVPWLEIEEDFKEGEYNISDSEIEESIDFYLDNIMRMAGDVIESIDSTVGELIPEK